MYGILYDDTSFTKCQINNAFIHKKVREAIKKDRKISKAILPRNEQILPYPLEWTKSKILEQLKAKRRNACKIFQPLLP